jgi:hypothetical protein
MFHNNDNGNNKFSRHNINLLIITIIMSNIKFQTQI